MPGVQGATYCVPIWGTYYNLVFGDRAVPGFAPPASDARLEALARSLRLVAAGNEPHSVTLAFGNQTRSGVWYYAQAQAYADQDLDSLARAVDVAIALRRPSGSLLERTVTSLITARGQRRVY